MNCEMIPIEYHFRGFAIPGNACRSIVDLVTATGRGDWGVGRHTIGSNFFHYIQDPWGSWFEYYSDMDFIDDYIPARGGELRPGRRSGNSFDQPTCVVDICMDSVAFDGKRGMSVGLPVSVRICPDQGDW
jgi:hypothetical protein